MDFKATVAVEETFLIGNLIKMFKYIAFKGCLQSNIYEQLSDASSARYNRINSNSPISKEKVEQASVYTRQ